MSPSGVNSEFRPLLRMTFPAGTGEITAGWRAGEKHFRSWILLAGVIPVEYDDVVFEEVEPGRRFLERSAMFTQRLWEHERIVDTGPRGSRITDRLRFEPRLKVLDAIYGGVFKAVFRWRHRNLRRLFGAESR